MDSRMVFQILYVLLLIVLWGQIGRTYSALSELVFASLFSWLAVLSPSSTIRAELSEVKFKDSMAWANAASKSASRALPLPPSDRWKVGFKPWKKGVMPNS